MGMTTKIIIVHYEHGVYLGSAMGLGFWSKLDDVGQDSAVLFNSEQEAREIAARWETQFNEDELTYVPLKVPEGWDYIQKEHIKQYW